MLVNLAMALLILPTTYLVYHKHVLKQATKQHQDDSSFHQAIDEQPPGTPEPSLNAPQFDNQPPDQESLDFDSNALDKYQYIPKKSAFQRMKYRLNEGVHRFRLLIVLVTFCWISFAFSQAMQV